MTFSKPEFQQFSPSSQKSKTKSNPLEKTHDQSRSLIVRAGDRDFVLCCLCEDDDDEEVEAVRECLDRLRG